jgi:xanthine dehydrogenase YagR molybdenum-binding subunit
MTGRFVNYNYSGYLVPTSADIPKLDILFVGEFDQEASPICANGWASSPRYRLRPRLPMRCITRRQASAEPVLITIEKLL